MLSRSPWPPGTCVEPPASHCRASHCLPRKYVEIEKEGVLETPKPGCREKAKVLCRDQGGQEHENLAPTIEMPGVSFLLKSQPQPSSKYAKPRERVGGEPLRGVRAGQGVPNPQEPRSEHPTSTPMCTLTSSLQSQLSKVVILAGNKLILSSPPWLVLSSRFLPSPLPTSPAVWGGLQVTGLGTSSSPRAG